MRAVVVEEPGPAQKMRVAEVAVPEPGPGEVSIDVDYAGVGFVDTLFRAGVFALPAPFTPGIEVAGQVRAVGAGVGALEPGQPVAAMLNDFGRGARCGGYAEVALARADMVSAVPAGLGLAAAAAALVNGTTALFALHELGRLAPGKDVVVLGVSGGLGNIAARIAVAQAARLVIGVVGSEERAERAFAAGCTDVVLAEEFADVVPSLTAGRGVDIVLDPVGGELRVAALAQLAPLGRLLVLGDASGDDRPLSGDAIWRGSAAVIGLSVGAVAHLIADRLGAATESLFELLSSGTLRLPRPAMLPLEQAPQAHELLEQRRAPEKILLTI